jgi:hypothetical protein
MRTGLILIATVALLPSAAIASDERRLSPEEVQQVLDKAAQKREAPTLAVAAPLTEEKALPRPIEGEIGVGIGTGGYREVFGTAAVPLGEDRVAIISFDNVQSHQNYRRRR